MSFGALAGNTNNRDTNDYSFRVRGYITADARKQTEYGTLRSYIAVGINDGCAAGTTVPARTAPSSSSPASRWVWRSRSSTSCPHAALSYFGGTLWRNGDSGDGGEVVDSYTAQFGNGLSATIGFEAPRSDVVFNGATAG